MKTENINNYSLNQNFKAVTKVKLRGMYKDRTYRSAAKNVLETFKNNSEAQKLCSNPNLNIEIILGTESKNNLLLLLKKGYFKMICSNRSWKGLKKFFCHEKILLQTDLVNEWEIDNLSQITNQLISLMTPENADTKNYLGEQIKTVSPWLQHNIAGDYIPDSIETKPSNMTSGMKKIDAKIQELKK